MASIKDLKKKTLDIESLKDKVKSGSSQKNNDDERLWRPYFDKDRGTAFARIRFLPAHPEEDLPFVKVFSHGFKGLNGKWYINNSLSTLGRVDPVGEMNSRLWNSGVESDKDVARKYKRKTSYYANVLVLEDPANPENEGQVKIYRYGPVVQKFIEDALDPEFEDETPMNPFDPFEGAEFTIRMRTDNEYVKYDKSSWSSPKPIADSDEKIEEIWNNTHKLQEFISEDNFKSYDELKNQLFQVLGPRVGKGPDGEGVATVEGLETPPEPKREKSKPSVSETEPDVNEESNNPMDELDSSDSSSDEALFDELFND